MRSGWLSRAELPLAQQLQVFRGWYSIFLALNFGANLPLQHVTAQSSGQCASSGQATPSQGQAAGKCLASRVKAFIWNQTDVPVLVQVNSAGVLVVR